MTTRVPEFATLRAQVLRPERPQLRAVDVALADLGDDPRGAWEALATRGLIPADWPTDPSRRFDELARHCPGCLRLLSECAVCFRRAPPAFDPPPGRPAEGLLEHPASRATLRGLASNPVAVTTAEALAREALARLPGRAPEWPHRSSPPRGLEVSHVAWLVLPERTIASIARTLNARARVPVALTLNLSRVRSRVGSAAKRAYEPGTERSVQAGLPDGTPDIVSLAAREFDLATWWKRVEDSAREPDPNAIVRPVGPARPVDEADNPFAPLLDIWALGFVPFEIRERTVWLIAPEPPDESLDDPPVRTAP